MKDEILSLLKKRMPEGKAPAEEIEKICREVTFDVVSSSCGDKEKREALRCLCDVLHFPIKAENRQLPEPVKETPSPLKDVFTFLLAGTAYYVGYSLSGSHWAGGIVCVVVGVLVRGVMDSKGTSSLQALSEVAMEGISPTSEEMAGKIGKVVEQLEKIIKQAEEDGSEDKEDMLENRYFKLLKLLYDMYVDYMIDGKQDEFQAKSIKRALDYSGYELLFYTEEDTEYFDSSLANHITECVTTMPALINKKTISCIIRGHVLFPGKAKE